MAAVGFASYTFVSTLDQDFGAHVWEADGQQQGSRPVGYMETGAWGMVWVERDTSATGDGYQGEISSAA